MITNSREGKAQAETKVGTESRAQSGTPTESPAIPDTILKTQLATLIGKLAGPNVCRQRSGDGYRLAWDHQTRKYYIELKEGDTRVAYYTLTPKAKMVNFNGIDVSRSALLRAEYVRIIEAIEKDQRKWLGLSHKS